jgi:hypothetical protein
MRFEDMGEKRHEDQLPREQPRPSGEEADKALREIVEQERERGEVNPGAEPDQKDEIGKPGDHD